MKYSMSETTVKQKLIVVRPKHLYPDDPVDRLRGTAIVETLHKRGWNIELFNNQVEIDLMIHLDDYNLYDRLIRQNSTAGISVIDIQDNRLNNDNPSKIFFRQHGALSRREKLKKELRKGLLHTGLKLLLKKLWHHLYLRSIHQADYLICSSHALAEAYKAINPRIRCIPDGTTVTALSSAEKHAKLSICWIGTQNNIAYLQLVDAVLSELQQKYSFDFCVISSKSILQDSQYKRMRTRCCFIKWDEATVQQELSRHHIAIAPLPTGSQKSTNKILTYMAAALPVICSGASDYALLYGTHPEAFIYLDNNDHLTWTNALEQLILDAKLRSKYATQARSLAESYSFDRIADMYETLFTELLEK